MWWKLQEKLELASNRLIKEHEEYAKWVIDENARRSRRCTETPELLSVQRPRPGKNTWLQPLFSTRPRLVHCARHDRSPQRRLLRSARARTVSGR